MPDQFWRMHLSELLALRMHYRMRDEQQWIHTSNMMWAAVQPHSKKKFKARDFNPYATKGIGHKQITEGLRKRMDDFAAMREAEDLKGLAENRAKGKKSTFALVSFKRTYGYVPPGYEVEYAQAEIDWRNMVTGKKKEENK